MRENIELNGRDVIICHPEKPNGKWALKTEYFDAFPQVQNFLLNLGYYIAHIKKQNSLASPFGYRCKSRTCKIYE